MIPERALKKVMRTSWETFPARAKTSHFGMLSLWLSFNSMEKRSSVKTLRAGCCVDHTVKAGAGGEQKLVTGLLGHWRGCKAGLSSSLGSKQK